MKYKEFRKQWLSHFARGISKKAIEKYVVSTGNFIWHIFSWELLPTGSFLEGDAAREAFDKLNCKLKESAIYIEPFEKVDSFSLSCNEATSVDLDGRTEIYVVAKDFSWTYIKTHEGYLCGPFFCRIK